MHCAIIKWVDLHGPFLFVISVIYLFWGKTTLEEKEAPQLNPHHPHKQRIRMTLELPCSFSEYTVWQCRLSRRSFIRTFWLVFCTALDISCQGYCMNGNCQAVPSLLPYVIANKSCSLDSLPNVNVWMDQVLSLFAYPESRRRGHDQDNFLSIAKVKPHSWPNDQQDSLNILPVTIKIAMGVNEFSTVAPTKPSTEWESHNTKVYSCNCFLAAAFTYHFQHLPVDAEVVTTLDTVAGDQTWEYPRKCLMWLFSAQTSKQTCTKNQ